MFRNLTSIQTYFLIAIALGDRWPLLVAFSSGSEIQQTIVVLMRVERLTRMEYAFFHHQPLNPSVRTEDWVYVPEMERCAPGPPLLDGGNPASGDNGGSGNATQGEEGS